MVSKAFIFAFAFCSCGNNAEAETVKYRADVIAVVDGDTVKIEFRGTIPQGANREERVRLIGVDTPELSSDEPWAKEARDFTNRQLYRKGVLIGLDKTLRDKYGRLLAYVWLGDALFNRVLISEGLGVYYGYFPFDALYMEAFKKAEEAAKAEGKNIWSGK
jgi:micrococcal nuclease